MKTDARSLAAILVAAIVGLVPAVAASAADTRKPAAVDVCGEAVRLAERRFAATPHTQTFEVEAPGSGTLCVEFRESAAAASTVGPGPEDPRSPRTGTVRAQIGETKLAASFAGREIDDTARFAEPTAGGVVAIRIDVPAGGVDVSVRFSPLALGRVALPERAVTCRGRLRGFEHPLRYSEFFLAPEGRREIERAGIPVVCRITFIDGPLHDPREIVVRGGGLTNAAGEYEILVPPTQRQSSNPNPWAQKLEVFCGGRQCGNEVEGAYLAFPDLKAEGELAFDVDLLNVVDIVAQGEWDANGDGTRSLGPLLGARLISMSGSAAQRNDRPFVVHEQLDVFNEEGTEFLAWGLNGQLARIPAPQRSALPCNVETSDYCIVQTDDCNVTHCGSDRFSCPGTSLLRVMLLQGYDVWLVDTLDGSADVMRVAAASPGLYVQILRFPAKAGAGTAAPAVTHETTLAGTQQPKKRMVVSGYSIGGVVARIALLLWERAEELPLADVVDFLGAPVTLPPGTPDLPTLDDHVKLYASIDAPHLGVRVPTAVQAYVRRIGEVVARFSELENASGFAARALLELDATSARQSLRERVAGSNELGCWDLSGAGDPGVSGCDVPRVHPSMEIVTDESAAFLASVAALDRGPGRIEDGLPESDRLLSIAYSNGSAGVERSPLRLVDTEEVVDIKFNIRPGGDTHHHLFDAKPALENTLNRPGRKYQPAGSQWNNSCQRIGNIELNLRVTHQQLLAATCSSIHPKDFPVLSCLGGHLLSIFNGVKLKAIVPIWKMTSAKNLFTGEPGAGFPTLIPTQSALLNWDPADPSAVAWHDARWQESDQFHTNVDDGLCRFVMFYADDALRGDADGSPACNPAAGIRGTFSDSCLLGARSPGNLRDPDGSFGPGSALCDPSEVPRPPGLGGGVFHSDPP